MATTLPTASEISRTNGLDLDEKLALEHFLGRTAEEALDLFKENVIFYSGDLMWMGPRGFGFYLRPLLAFLTDENGEKYPDLLMAVSGLLRFRLIEMHERISPELGEALNGALQWTLNNYERFQIDEALCGNLRQDVSEVLLTVEK